MAYTSLFTVCGLRCGHNRSLLTCQSCELLSCLCFLHLGSKFLSGSVWAFLCLPPSVSCPHLKLISGSGVLWFDLIWFDWFYFIFLLGRWCGLSVHMCWMCRIIKRRLYLCKVMKWKTGSHCIHKMWVRNSSLRAWYLWPHWPFHSSSSLSSPFSSLSFLLVSLLSLSWQY